MPMDSGLEYGELLEIVWLETSSVCECGWFCSAVRGTCGQWWVLSNWTSFSSFPSRSSNVDTYPALSPGLDLSLTMKESVS